MDKIIKDLFIAYYDCRKNKKNTINAKKFEMNYEKNIFILSEEIKNKTYEIGKSVVFIVKKPVKREIFAADFRDRVVHHFLINKLNKLFEDEFIVDSYACRKNKGTLFGINRIFNFIKECSENYKKDCFILKMDIQGFFMNIDKNILNKILIEFIENKYKKEDKETVLFLTDKILKNNPRNNCIVKGKKNDWVNLPKNKSLFGVPEHCGLPIGNLTSQIFANMYLNLFDKYIKNELNIEFYGRYVDDFILIHKDKDFLLSIKPKIKEFLEENLHLILHPKKTYFQNYKKGVLFLGAFLLPKRIYIKNNLKGNIFWRIKKFNNDINNIEKNKLEEIVSVVNSYMGLFSKFNTYKLRCKILNSIKSDFSIKNNDREFFLTRKNNFLKIKNKII